MIHAYGGESYPNQPVADSQEGITDITKINTLEAVEFGHLKNVQQLMEEEANKVNEKQKQKFHKDVMEELQMIEKSLTKMIDENSHVTDIEMLERDEFVVDVMRQDKFVAEGEKVCDKIRKEAEKNVLRLQLLRERVKTNTYDTMDV